jgi:hypothetical protein
MHNPKILILASLIALLAAGCASVSEPAAPSATSERSTPSSAAPTNGVDAGRYVNAEAGLSLALPEGWTAAGPFSVAVGDTSYNLYVLGREPSLEGGPGASRLIVAADEKLSIDAFIASQCSTCPPVEITGSTVNGIPIQRAIIGGGGVPFQVEWIFLENDGRLVGLSIHDPQTLEPLMDVSATLLLE